MGKVKLSKFGLAAGAKDSKRIVDYLQRYGCTHIENVDIPELRKQDNTQYVLELIEQQKCAKKALDILGKSCSIKKNILTELTDYKEIAYDDYKHFLTLVEETADDCREICRLSEEIDELNADIIRLKTQIDYLRPWETLDIPMSSKRTEKTAIFIGYVKSEMTESRLRLNLAEADENIDGVAISEISIDKMQSCFVVMCHHSMKNRLENALLKIGFVSPDTPSKSLPSFAIKELLEKIKSAENEADKIREKITSYADRIEQIKYLIDYYSIESDKYKTIENAGISGKVIYFEGYIPTGKGEDFKYSVETKFVSAVSVFEPDYETEDVPVMLNNGSFASGVESVTDMYAVPSNNDVDPNPVMAFFYYSLFGLMLSDGGYGILMVFFGALMKWKFKVTGGKLKTANFAFFCGIATVFWGALFGSWFGDLIPTICTTFLKMENGPNLVIWFDPKEDSMKLLLYSFGFGIIHLFAGLAIRFYNLCKHRHFFGAVCDVVPVYLFVAGFAVIGKDFIEPVSENVKSVGLKLFLIGAVLIILTAGRSAKNIFGKLGGGLYGLYNTTTGYMSDILSYSRLLALNLVTGVISMVVNLLAAMPGNIVFFIIIFIVGHSINLAINLIGTYVHTNRLQYVEFFSKFYEGGGRVFTPFRMNTNYLRFKEDK